MAGNKVRRLSHGLVSRGLGWGVAAAIALPILGVHPGPALGQTAPASAAEGALNQGLALIQQGQVDEALAQFKQAAALDPAMAAAHYNVGLALRQQGQIQAAASAFWQAIRADPEFALAYANLGGALVEGNNLDQAEAYLLRAIAIQPNLGNAHHNLGLVYQSQRRYPEALAAFERAGQYSAAAESYLQRGLIYLQTDRSADAQAVLQQALAINPRYAQAHYNLGIAQFNQGQTEAALDSFRLATQINGGYADAYYSAGLAFIKLNRFDEARTVLEYAKNLYITLGNPAWAARAQGYLSQLPAAE